MLDGKLRSDSGKRVTLLIGCALTCALLMQVVRPTNATFFILGGLCDLGLDALLDIEDTKLRALGIEGDVETIRNFCDIIYRYSIEYIIGSGLVGGFRDLVRFVAEGDLEGRGEDLARLVGRLAFNIRRFVARNPPPRG